MSARVWSRTWYVNHIENHQISPWGNLPRNQTADLRRISLYLLEMDENSMVTSHSEVENLDKIGQICKNDHIFNHFPVRSVCFYKRIVFQNYQNQVLWSDPPSHPWGNLKVYQRHNATTDVFDKIPRVSTGENSHWPDLNVESPFLAW